MREGYRLYKGKAYKDPGGYRLEPNTWWDDEPLLDIKPWHPALFWKYLIHLAVWDERGWKVRRKTDFFRIERGQLYHSARWLGKRPGWSKDRVIRELERLRDDGRILLEARQGGTVVTIVNYDPYQDHSFYGETQGQVLTGSRIEKRDAKRDTNRDGDKYMEPSEDKPDSGAVARQEARQISRRRRDADETVLDSEDSVDKNARARGETHQVASARQEGDQPPTTWQQIQGAVKSGFWNSLPTHIRTTMILEALDHELPPADIAPAVLRLIETLDIQIPDGTREELTRLMEPEEDEPDDTTAEDTLRAKLQKIRNGGQTR